MAIWSGWGCFTEAGQDAYEGASVFIPLLLFIASVIVFALGCAGICVTTIILKQGNPPVLIFALLLPAALCVVYIMYAAKSLPSSLPVSEVPVSEADARAKDVVEITLSDLTRLAKNGDRGAQYALGSKYINGEEGVSKDEAKGIEYYAKSANRGYAHAQRALGKRYINGCGVMKDESYGVELLTKAAAQGDEVAQRLLDEIKAEQQGGGSRDNR